MAALASLAGLPHAPEGLREVVEHALDSDDFLPLARLIFDAQPSEALPQPQPRGDSESGTSGGGMEAVGNTPLEGVLAVLHEVAEDREAEIQQICRTNAAEIAGALHELGTMQRLATSLKQQLQDNSASLQQGGQGMVGQLEELHHISRVQAALTGARQAVSTATQVLSLCVRAGRYIEFRQLYKAYRVLETIQRDHGPVLRAVHDHRPPLAQAAADSASSVGTGPGALPIPARAPGRAATGGSASALAAQVAPLAPFLRERVRELTNALEQQALAEFNNWLVGVRTQARTIGMRAIRRAAAERQHEEQLSKQRKVLLQQLPALRSTAEAAALVAQALRAVGVQAGAPAATPLPLPRGTPSTPGSSSSRPAETGSPSSSASAAAAGAAAGSSSGTVGGRYASFRASRHATGSPPRSASPAGKPGAEQQGTPGSAAPSSKGQGSASGGSQKQQHLQQHEHQQPPSTPPREPDASEATGDLLAGVDMAPLHRCVHIHACLGRLASLQEYYATNRRQQLEADLVLQGAGAPGAGVSASASFLESYQAYLTQVVGYFLVEDRVQQSAPELGLGPQVDAAWEAAVKSLKGLLESAFEGATAAAAMLTVKDFMLLLCLALGHCGYHTATISEILVAGRARYHDLLAAAAASTVQAAVARDALAPVEVATQGKADEYFRVLALPATFKQEDLGLKRPPCRAPFSAMVPDLVRTIRGYIIDSVAYLKGLVTAGEVLPAAKQHRDRMLASVVAPALQRRVDAAAGDARLPLQARLQLVANIAALMQAVVPLDDFALLQARGEEAEQAVLAARGSPGHSPSRSASPGPGPGPGRPSSPPRLLATSEAGSAAAEEGAGARGRPRSAELPAGGARPSSRQRSPGADSSRGSAPSPPGSPTAASAQQQQQPQQQQSPAGHSVLSVSASAAGSQRAGDTASSAPAAGLALAPAASGAAAAALQAVLESAEALVMQALAAQASPVLARGELLDWVPDEPLRNVGAVSPYMEELIMLLKESQSSMRRQVLEASAARMMAGVLANVGDAIMLQLMSDAIPTFNIFALQRLFADLGGLSRAAESMGPPELAARLQEALLFCEVMVFGTLEELLDPELRAGKYAPLNLRRVVLILDKYRELDRSSKFKSMHKSRQAERFISRKTVEGVARQLRELLKGERSPSAASLASSSIKSG